MTAAAAGAAVAAAEWMPPSGGMIVTAALLFLMSTLAQIWPLHLSTKIKVTVDDLPTFAAALLFDPFTAMLIAGASTLGGLQLRKGRMRWYTRGFNTASASLGTGLAAALYHGLGGTTPPAMSAALPIFAAGVAKYVLQALVVDVVVALQLRRRPLDRWWETHRRDVPYESSLYLLGALAAVSAGDEPVALTLFAIPMVAMLAAMRETARVREQTRNTILELSDLIDLRDPYTHGHSQRVAEYAERLAKRMRLTSSQIALVRDAARVHDIGKIGTNDMVLLKKGPLDDAERSEMQRHVEIGHRLLRHIPEFFEGAELVLAHHERHDGTGYPRGLKGDELPLEVSVISVADSYDAMTTDRPYRRGLPWPAVRAELLRNRDTQWRAEAVNLFVEMIDADLAISAAKSDVALVAAG